MYNDTMGAPYSADPDQCRPMWTFQIQIIVDMHKTVYIALNSCPSCMCVAEFEHQLAHKGRYASVNKAHLQWCAFDSVAH